MTPVAQLLLFEPWTVTERVSRRARRIRVDLQPDGTVVLTIPARVPRADARAFLEKQHGWIERTRAKLVARRRETPPLRRLGLSPRALRGAVEIEARELLDVEASRLGVRYTGLAIRDTRTRWGSCALDGRIMLSLRLALAPPEVLRYVVVHELCHLRWRGHGVRFWALVAKQMPEFEAQRAWLRRHGDALHAVPVA